MERNVEARLDWLDAHGGDTAAARQAYAEWDAVKDAPLPETALDSLALAAKEQKLEGIVVRIGMLRSTPTDPEAVAEVRSLVEQRSMLARQIDAARNEREAVSKASTERGATLGRLRVRAEAAEKEALEAWRVLRAEQIEAAVLEEPVCLRFPDEIPGAALRLLRETEDAIERLFPAYLPRERFFDLMDDRVAKALRARNRGVAL